MNLSNAWIRIKFGLKDPDRIQNADPDSVISIFSQIYSFPVFCFEKYEKNVNMLSNIIKAL
jgi:hypothetical protein